MDEIRIKQEISPPPNNDDLDMLDAYNQPPPQLHIPQSPTNPIPSKHFSLPQSPSNHNKQHHHQISPNSVLRPRMDLKYREKCMKQQKLVDKMNREMRTKKELANSK